MTNETDGMHACAPEHRVDLPEDTEPATDLSRAVGKQVKVLRERAGLTQRELGERINYSEETVSSVERGRRTPQPDFLDAVDDALDAGGVLRAAKEDIEKAKSKARVRHPAWFRDYARLEAESVEINEYSNHDLPGLLQSEGRVRALYAMRKPLLDDQTIEERVISRLARQDALTRWPAPSLTAVIEEVVLLRSIGGRDVHGEQLEHLLELGQRRNVELQVMPLDQTEHASMGGPFTLLSPKGRPQLAYVEVQHVARLITDAEVVRSMAARYGSIRAQALTPGESLNRIGKIMGAL